MLSLVSHQRRTVALGRHLCSGHVRPHFCFWRMVLEGVRLFNVRAVTPSCPALTLPFLSLTLLLLSQRLSKAVLRAGTYAPLTTPMPPLARKVLSTLSYPHPFTCVLKLAWLRMVVLVLGLWMALVGWTTLATMPIWMLVRWMRELRRRLRWRMIPGRIWLSQKGLSA